MIAGAVCGPTGQVSPAQERDMAIVIGNGGRADIAECRGGGGRTNKVLFGIEKRVRALGEMKTDEIVCEGWNIVRM